MIAARAIVTDIEGTTSAISFVRDVLFPYADRRLDGYVAAHAGEAVVANALREAAIEAGEPEIWTNDRHLLAASAHCGIAGRSV